MKTLNGRNTIRVALGIISFVFVIPVFHAYAADKSGVSPNTISLPSGPGSIEGLGESFQPTLNTGTAKYAFGLKVSPGTGGHAPRLSLSYDGGGSNGPLGFGWKLSGSYVQRQTDKGIPRYIDGANTIDDDANGIIDNPEEIDIFINSLGEELVLTDGGFFFCENEGAFIRYKRVGAHWEANLPDGTFLQFGLTESGRITDVETGRVFKWLLEKKTDTNGNTIRYNYTSFPDSQNKNQKYLSKIEYGPGAPPWKNFHFISFEYETRSDWFEDNRSGFVVRTGKRIKTIVMGTQGPTLEGHASGDFNQDGITDHLNRKYGLAYTGHIHWSLLSSIKQIGADGVSSLPPAEFGYTGALLPDTINASGSVIGGLNEPFQAVDNALVDFADMNGDGLPDIVKTDRFGGTHVVYTNKGEKAVANGNRVIKWGTPAAIEGDKRAWAIDLSSDTGNVAHFADMDADGRADLVYKSATGDVYYFSNQANNSWGPRQKMSVGNISPPSPFASTEVRTVDIDFNKHVDIIQSIDVGGIAYYRIWLNLGNQTYAASQTITQDQGYLFSQKGVHIADFNGDRVPDILRVRPTGIDVLPGLGHGKFAPKIHVVLPDYTLDAQTTGQIEKAKLQDITGDGLTDLVIERAVPGQLWYWVNLGNYTFDKRRVITGLPTGLGMNPEIRWADLNGNGTTDLIYADSKMAPRMQTLDIGELIGAVPGQNMMKTIMNGIGGKTTIDYTTSAKYSIADAEAGAPWLNPLPFPVNVVSKVTVEDSMGNAYVTKFSYHDGYYDGAEKEFRGFAHVETREIGDATIPDLIMAYTFNTGDVEEALKGKAMQVEARNGDNEIFFRETNSWLTRTLHNSSTGDQRKVTFPFRKEKVKTVIEKGNGDPVQVKWEYEYDNFGNLTRQFEHGRMDPGWDDERVSETVFSSLFPDGIFNWIISAVVEQKIEDENGVKAAHLKNYYDKSDALGIVHKGNLTKTESWVKDDEWVATARSDFDTFGNITAIYDPLYGLKPGHKRKLIYDAAFHTFPEKEIIYTGKENLQTLESSATYDKGLGSVLSSTEFNGHTTIFKYDVFARLTSITKPSELNHTVEYDYVLKHDLGYGKIINWVETRQRDASPGDGFLHSRSFHDGLGRKIMTRGEGEDPNQVVVTDIVKFNARQLPRKQYWPYFDTGKLDFVDSEFITGFTEHFYDAMGRVVKVKTPPDDSGTISSASTQYFPLNTISIDENSNRKRQFFDGLERLIKIEEYNKGQIYPTHYTYNTLGGLTGIVDAQNNTKTIAYDALGRKTTMEDPDRGHMGYEYDESGNLIRTIDNKRQTIEYTYDGANRMLSEDYLNGAGKTPDVVYQYDTPSPEYPDATSTIGKLAWLEDLSGGSFVSYDAKGNLNWSVTRIRDGQEVMDFETLNEYDAMNRLTATRYPDGDRVTFEYNNRSQLKTIPGFVNRINYHASGQRSSIEYQNNITTTYLYDPRHRLKRLTSTNRLTITGSPVQDLTYTFDGVSNILGIQDHRPLTINSPKSGTQFFQYDDLYRLTQAKGPGYGEINYQYDRIGNMIFKKSPVTGLEGHVADPLINLGTIENGGGLGGDSYRSGKSSGDPPGPHAVTATESGLAYDYDDNGNMISHGEGDVYEWNFKDRLIKVITKDSISTYAYNSSGQRKIKKVKKGGIEETTYYVSKAYEIRNRRPIKYVFDDQSRIARVEGRLAKTGEHTTQILNFKQKWNFFSLEVEPDNPSISTVLSQIAGKFTEIYTFDAGTQQYVGYNPSQGIFDLKELHAQTAYIINITKPTRFNIEGIRTTNSLTLLEGWNLIPSPVDTKTDITAALELITDIYQAVWGYKTESGVWKGYLPNQNLQIKTLINLEPDQAYWIKMNAPSTLPYQTKPLETNFYHTDHLGSSSVMTDMSGTIKETTEFYPFGRPRHEERVGFDSVYKYTGKELDKSTSLMYYEARYYDSVVGSFLSVDPLFVNVEEIKDNFFYKPSIILNSYEYTTNNPFKYVDRKGTNPDAIFEGRDYEKDDVDTINNDMGVLVDLSTSLVSRLGDMGNLVAWGFKGAGVFTAPTALISGAISFITVGNDNPTLKKIGLSATGVNLAATFAGAATTVYGVSIASASATALAGTILTLPTVLAGSYALTSYAIKDTYLGGDLGQTIYENTTGKTDNKELQWLDRINQKLESGEMTGEGARWASKQVISGKGYLFKSMWEKK